MAKKDELPSRSNADWEGREADNAKGRAPSGRGDGKYTNAPFWKKGHRG